jgi:hypothetical protein
MHKQLLKISGEIDDEIDQKKETLTKKLRRESTLQKHDQD